MHKWEDLDVHEISQVAFTSIQAGINEHNNHPTGFNKENLNFENVENWLRNLQSRFPASIFIFARSNNKLVGWLSIESGGTLAEIGRWHPYVDPNSNESEIASKLIEQSIDHVKKQGQTRLEITFSGLTEETEWLYKKYKAWYESQNMKIMMEEIFMRSDLSELEVPNFKLPTNLEVKSITETDEEEYYDCYYETFIAGKDRLFLDQTEKQRREGFQEYYDRSRPFNEETSIVLIKNNRICGFSFVRLRGEEGHLALIGIHPDFQRKNLGKALLYLIMKRLAQQGLKTISLGVDPVNKPAYNLYRSLGFKIISRSVTHVWKSVNA